ncbi:hypothetical protein SELMODRAFT_417053 [Selaginella moellendorffii]|uniref:Uncharacterized protein n=1 Tax=Selaginella moellendorffii TaxID=88036 RepID=D8S178_SELML|nr:hypothetical protein SELMODRAFT_417053 [Selaginella moellendorffii]
MEQFHMDVVTGNLDDCIVRLPLDSTQSGLWATIPVNGVPISFLVDTDIDDIRESFIQAPEVDGVDCIYCRNISFSDGLWVKGHVKKNEWMTKRPDGSRGNTVKALLGLSRRMDSVVTQWKYTSFSFLYTGVFNELVFGVSGHPYCASVVGLVKNQNILTTRVYRISYDWKYEEYAFDIPWDTGSEDTWFEPKFFRIIVDMIKSKDPVVFLYSEMRSASTMTKPRSDLTRELILKYNKNCMSLQFHRIRVVKCYDYSHLQTTMTMNGKSSGYLIPQNPGGKKTAVAKVAQNTTWKAR